MSEDTKNTGQAADSSDEIVSPDEHAEVTEGIDPTTDVSDPSVPDNVEVAARSADMNKASTTHEKVFVLGPGLPNVSGDPYTEKNGYDHEPNKLAVRQYMIDQGLWPTAPVEFKSAKRHPDGASWVLTYTAEAIPTADAANSGSTHPTVSAPAEVEKNDEGQAVELKSSEPTNYAPPPEGQESDGTTD